jgi:hypothetical protein
MSASSSAATVDITVSDNVTWCDAFMFGIAGDTSWNFTGKSFIMEVKADVNDTVALFTLSTALGSIVTDDAVLRVLHFLVTETALRAALPVGTYVYDLVMFDGSSPPVRTLLMTGNVYVVRGVTGD